MTLNKNTIINFNLLAILVSLTIPTIAQAEVKQNYAELQVSCTKEAQCDRFDSIEYATDRDTVAQRTRRTSSSDSKFYFGGTLGVISTRGIGDAAVGGSIFGGRELNSLLENLSAEGELFYFRGGTSVDDLGYSLLGILANAKYTIPFDSDSSTGWYGFFALGAGVNRFALTGDRADRRDDLGFDNDTITLALQGKGGVGYYLNEKIGVFGQLRYLETTSNFRRGFVGSATGDGFSFEIGANVKL